LFFSTETPVRKQFCSFLQKRPYGSSFVLFYRNPVRKQFCSDPTESGVNSAAVCRCCVALSISREAAAKQANEQA